METVSPSLFISPCIYPLLAPSSTLLLAGRTLHFPFFFCPFITFPSFGLLLYMYVCFLFFAVMLNAMHCLSLLISRLHTNWVVVISSLFSMKNGRFPVNVYLGQNPENVLFLFHTSALVDRVKQSFIMHKAH